MIFVLKVCLAHVLQCVSVANLWPFRLFVFWSFCLFNLFIRLIKHLEEAAEAEKWRLSFVASFLHLLLPPLSNDAWGGGWEHYGHRTIIIIMMIVMWVSGLAIPNWWTLPHTYLGVRAHSNQLVMLFMIVGRRQPTATCCIYPFFTFSFFFICLSHCW